LKKQGKTWIASPVCAKNAALGLDPASDEETTSHGQRLQV
jgi:hypothetical protein